MTTARAAAILLTKELRLEFRTRELLNATIIFALIVVVLFSFAFDPTAGESRRYGPGLLWIAFLFAGSLMLHPSFGREQANQTLDALRMAPISPFAILLGKMLANLLFLLAAEVILVPVFAVLYDVSLAGIVGRLILVFVLGTLGENTARWGPTPEEHIAAASSSVSLRMSPRQLGVGMLQMLGGTWVGTVH